jgi:Penicillin-insensitive murein endopeptidase
MHGGSITGTPMPIPTSLNVIECPLWGRNGHHAKFGSCPLYPSSRHFTARSRCPLCAKGGHGPLNRLFYWRALVVVFRRTRIRRPAFPKSDVSGAASYMRLVQSIITFRFEGNALKVLVMKSLIVLAAFSVAVTCAAAAKSTAPAPIPLPRNNPLKSTEQENQQTSKPASALFSEKKLPSLGTAVAIGYYPRGCLQGGVELPTTGPTWQIMRLSRNRNWGHPDLVKFLERFAPLAAEATGGREF